MHLTPNSTRWRLLFRFWGPSVSPFPVCGPGMVTQASGFSINIVP